MFLLHLDVGGYGVYISTGYGFLYIVLPYGLSLELSASDFKLIFFTEIPK